MNRQTPITDTWERVDGPRPLVLVVEDNWDARQLYTELLMYRGFRVAACEDGQEALALVRARRPAAIVLDLNLPVISGWSVAETLRSESETRTIPIFAITAHADAASVGRARAVGCDRVFTKPVDHRSLVRELLAVTRTR